MRTKVTVVVLSIGVAIASLIACSAVDPNPPDPHGDGGQDDDQDALRPADAGSAGDAS